MSNDNRKLVEKIELEQKRRFDQKRIRKTKIVIKVRKRNECIK